MKSLQLILVTLVSASVYAQTLTSPPVGRITTVFGPVEAVTPQNAPDVSEGEFTFFTGDSSVSGTSTGQYGNGVTFATLGKASVCGGISANIQPTHGRIRVLTRGTVEWITSEAISSSDPNLTFADTLTGVNAFGGVKLLLQAPTGANLELKAATESSGSALAGTVLTGAFFDRRPLSSPVLVEQNVPFGIVSSASGAEGTQAQSITRIVPAGTTTQFDFRVGATTFPFAKESRGKFETMLTLDYGGCDLAYVSGTDLGAAATWFPARVPFKDDAGCGNLLIDRTGALELTFGNVTANALAVRRATVTLSGGLLSLAGFAEGPELLPAPPEVGEPALSEPCAEGVREHINNRLHVLHPSLAIGNGGAIFLKTGTYDLFNINLGDLAGIESLLVLNTVDAIVNVASDIFVGDASAATLSIPKGRITSELGSIILSNGNGDPARMLVGGPTDADAVVTCKRLAVGGGADQLSISRKGVFNCEEAEVGFVGTGESEIAVQLGGEMNITNNFGIGMTAKGFCNVLAQGKVNCGTLTIGDLAPGRLSIVNVGTLVNAAGETIVGRGNSGDLRIENEGRLRAAGSFIAGRGGRAIVELNDATLDALGGVQIGDGEFASLTADASIINAVNIRVGGPSFGKMTVRSDSEVNAASLFIDSNGELVIQEATINVSSVILSGKVTVQETAQKQVDASNVLNGDVTFSTSSRTVLDLTGGNPVPLSITGNCTLGGALEIRFADDAVLNAGQNIELLQFGQPPSGAFSGFTFPTRSGDFAAETNFSNGSLVLNIVNPGTAVISEGEGESQTEGEVPVEGEGEAPAEGEGETLIEGEGEAQVEYEGETPAEGEGEEGGKEDSCGCYDAPSTKALLGDWLLMGLALMVFASLNPKMKQ